MKNKKILFLGIGLLVLLVAATVTTILVINNRNSECSEHSYGSWTTKVEATCFTEGTKERICTKCEHKDEEKVAPLGHNYGAWSDEVAVTCLANGLRVRTCTLCSIREEEVVQAKGHIGGTATCTEKAVCTVCQQPYGDEPSHKFGEYVETVKATCTTDGKKVKTCSVCFTTDEQIINALKHNYESTVVDASCLTGGYTLYKCTRENCQVSYTDSYIQPLGHDWDKEIECESGHTCKTCGAVEDGCGHNYEEINHVLVSCLLPESYDYKCENCGDTYSDVIGLPLGHNISGVVGVEELVEGCEYKLMYQCNDCDDVIEGQHIHKHEYTATISKHATCVENGEKLLTCKYCSGTDTEVILKNKHSHSLDAGVLEGNIRTYSCLNTGCSHTETVVDASSSTKAEVSSDDLANAGAVELQNSSIKLDQSTLDQMAGKDLTISSETLKDEVLEEVINNLTPEQQDQLGANPTIYNFLIEESGSAISEFDGLVTVTLPYTLKDGEDVNSIAVWYMNGDTPEAIQAVYSNGYITFETSHFSFYTVTRLTPKERCETYGHQWIVEEVEGTCTRDGYMTKFCQCCHETVKEVTSVAQGHDYQEASRDNATCTTNGLVVYACSVCEHSYKQRLVAQGHILEVSNEISATCTEIGYKEYACANCEYTAKGAIVAALGHDYEYAWSWSADHTHATIRFVCGNNAEHVQEVIGNAVVTEEPATCLVAGERTYSVAITFDGANYTNEFKEEIPTLEHNFVDGFCSNCGKSDGICRHQYVATYNWNTDHSKATIQLICKFDNTHVEEVEVDSIVNETPSTCVIIGSKVYTVSLVFAGVTYTDSYTEELPLADHNYVDDVCSVCGKEAELCNHEELHDEVIFVSEYGACDGIISYKTCECGEAKISQIPIEVLFNYSYSLAFFGLGCSNHLIPIEEREYSEGDNEYMYLKVECSECDLNIEFLASHILNKCKYTTSYTMTIYYGEEVIIEYGDSYEDIEYEHNYRRESAEYIDLGLYGCCGGVVTYYRCLDCDEICESDDYKLKCENLIETEEEIELENEYKEIYKMTCPDCGIELYSEEYEIYNDCYEYEYYKYGVKINGQVILEVIEEYEYSYHSLFESEEDPEIIMLGDTCEEGYKTDLVCKYCDEKITMYGIGHIYTDYEEYDATELGICGGTYTKTKCFVCEDIKDIESVNSTCSFSDPIEDSYVDEDEITHFTYSMTCSECNLTIEYDMYEVQIECDTYHYNVSKVFKDGVELCVNTNIEVEDCHNYQERRTLLGDVCSDGVLVEYVCSKCENVQYSYNTDSHYAEQEFLECDEICGNGFYAYICKDCDTIVNIDYYKHNWSYDVELSEILTGQTFEDADGIINYRDIYRCIDCNLIRCVTNMYIPTDIQCIYNSATEYEYIFNDEVVLSYIYCDFDKNDAKHNIENTYKLLGETCEDGYLDFETCKDCGIVRYINIYDEHSCDYMSSEIKLEDHGGCNGSIIINSCPCGKLSYIDMNIDECEFALVTEEEFKLNGVTCTKCGLNIKYSEKVEEVGCFSYRYEYYSISINSDVLIDNGEYLVEIEEHHVMVAEFDGVHNCQGDKYTVTFNCVFCDYSYNFNSSYCEEYLVYYEVIEDSDCGPIEIGVYSCVSGEHRKLYINYECESFTEEYREEVIDGVIHYIYDYVCEDCNILITTDLYNIEDGCYLYNHDIISIKKDDTLIYQEDLVYNVNVNHNIEIRYELKGDDCYDGVTWYYECSECDYAYSRDYSYHYTQDYYLNLEEFGACYGHISYSYCACGYNHGFEQNFCYDHVSDSYVETIDGIDYVTKVYECFSCGLTITISDFKLQEGCYDYLYSIYNITINDTVILEDVYFYRGVESNHLLITMFDQTLDTCENVSYSYTEKCVNCDYEYSGYHGDYNGNSYQHLVEYQCIMENECGKVEMYKYSCVCGKHTSSTLNFNCENVDIIEDEYVDADGVQHYLEQYTCLDCGLHFEGDFYYVEETCVEYIYCLYTVTLNDEVIYSEELVSSSTIEHDLDVNYVLNGESCEDGVYVYKQCKNCDYYSETEYSHHINEGKYIDFTEYGACYGQLSIYDCPCGYLDYSHWYSCGSYFTNYEIDEDGNKHTIKISTCTTCKLRFTEDIYSIYDAENCKEYIYTTYNFIINGKLVLADYTLVSVNEKHDYDLIYQMHGDSCEDGVDVYKQCKVCGDSHESQYSGHERVNVEQIDLSSMDCTCPTNFYITTCLCGYSTSYEIEEECDLECMNNWITEDMDLFGYKVYEVRIQTYTCAVTDPECNFCYRVIRYYEKENESDCTANEYYLIQLGYDKDENTSVLEYKYSTGGKIDIHTYDYEYDEGEWENGTYRSEVEYCVNGCIKYIDNYYYNEYNDCVKRTEESIRADGTYHYYCYEYAIFRNLNDDTEYTREEIYYKHDSIDLNGEEYHYEIFTTYNYPDDCTKIIEEYNNGNYYIETVAYHLFTKYETIKDNTCSQSGQYGYRCDLCNEVPNIYYSSPIKHRWYELPDGHYYCYCCGIESLNGVNGDIIIEDFTDKLGNDEYFVLGYYNPYNYLINVFVSIVSYEDGQMFVINPTVYECSDIVGYQVSMNEVYSLAADLGYEYGEYYVMIELIPVGYESDFVYGIGFDTKEDNEFGIDKLNIVYVSAGETFSYEFTPEVSGYYKFASYCGNDTYGNLYDDDNYSVLANDDDSGIDRNFLIKAYLEAGVTYRLNVQFYSSSVSGYIPFYYYYLGE